MNTDNKQNLNPCVSASIRGFKKISNGQSKIRASVKERYFCGAKGDDDGFETSLIGRV